MPTPNLAYPLQSLGAGSTTALALKEFSGMVLTALANKTVAMPFVTTKTVTQGNSWQFPALWKATVGYHTAGTALTGTNEPIVEERTIALDSKQIAGSRILAEYDDLIAHFDTRQQAAFELGQGIAEFVDSILLRQIALGARQSARSSFPAGNVLTTARSGASLLAAYPISSTGSGYLQADLGEIGRKMSINNVPREGRVAFMDPLLYQVLRQDNTLLSRDYQNGTNEKLPARMTMAEGFMIVETNLMPNANVTSSVNSNYDGDFSLTACLCLGHPTGVGHIRYRDGVVPEGPTWIPDRLAWLISARYLQGSKWLRPEACGEIARVPQIVGTRAGDGLVDHVVDIEGDRARFGVVKNLALPIGQPGRGEVVDINGFRRGTHCYISVLVVMFGALHAHRRPTYRPSWRPRRDPRRDQ